jgi:RimJ/RimL family protein N-acetyltransferase
MDEEITNALGQPIGFPLPDWSGAKRPPRTPMEGRFCRLVPLDPARHAAPLYEAYGEDTEGRMWTYLQSGTPFNSANAYRTWLEDRVTGDDPICHAILDGAAGLPVGTANYMRIDPQGGSIEVGSITYSPRLQKTTAATEAMYLMMRRVFDELGYRRYEWKCDALNAGSRAAAARLGFTYEGLFRQATVYKGRNRDTAWYSIIDREWPARRAAFEDWLAPSNFDANGRQHRSLGALIAAHRN